MPDALPAYGPRACRELRGITLAQLAELTGYNPDTLGKIERSYLRRASGDATATLPPYPTALRIAHALAVPVDALYRFDRFRTQNAPGASGTGPVSADAAPRDALAHPTPHHRRRAFTRGAAASPSAREVTNA